MKFKYKVFGQDTNIIAGVIDTASRQLAIDRLQSEGNIIIEIEEVASDYDLKWYQKIFETITTKELVVTVKQLASLISGGVQTLRAFRLISGETHNPAIKRTFEAVAEDIQAGSPLWKSLARQSSTFNGFFVSIIHAGEESGNLKDSMNYLADYIERNYELNQKVKKALTYPVFVIITFIAVMIIMTVFVIPKLAEMLIEQGRDLPWYTELVLGISNTLISYWYMIIALLFGFYFYVRYLNSTPEGRAYFDFVKLKSPIVGELYKKLFLARFADNLDTMLSSGLSLVETLRITSEVVDNYVFKKILERLAEKVGNGKSLSSVMAEEPMMPSIMVQMARIGEETGSLGNMLKSIAAFYKKELERTIDTSIALIEPIMIVVLAVSVGFLIASILLPLYDIATGIQ